MASASKTAPANNIDAPQVLVAEDDPAVRSAVVRVLELEGYCISAVNNGVAALAAITSSHPDAVVMDVMMPFADGLTVCREARLRGSRVPILLLTAKHEVNDRVAGLDAGADDYLVKPFSIDELLARVRALLRRRVTTEEATVLQVGDLILDAARRQVNRNGREIRLTKTEFDLLEALMLRAGLVVTRDHLYEEIWGYDFETGSKSLDVYIGYLRRKTEENGDPRIVFTVRGIGYTVKA
jgi:two-component system response regulator MprA